MPLPRPAVPGANKGSWRYRLAGKVPATSSVPRIVETRLLILNADPVFQDRALAILDEFDRIETRVVRTMPEAVSSLLAENFDGFIVEGETPLAGARATSPRQHFPSLRIVCLSPKSKEPEGI